LSAIAHRDRMISADKSGDEPATIGQLQVMYSYAFMGERPTASYSSDLSYGIVPTSNAQTYSRAVECGTFPTSVTSRSSPDWLTKDSSFECSGPSPTMMSSACGKSVRRIAKARTSRPKPC